MEPLMPPDLHYLQAAQGWIALGNDVEAAKELGKISPLSCIHADVLEVHCEIYANARNWDGCVGAASALVEVAPERSSGWIKRSLALNALKRTQEAFDYLLPVADKFPDLWAIPFNLARYCAQLQRFDEAKDWLKNAVIIGQDVALCGVSWNGRSDVSCL